MKKALIFLAVFLYADISEILLEIEKIEKFKPKFDKIYVKKCNKKKNMKIISKKKTQKELKLLAIFNKKALINNKWVREGDIIEGYRVKCVCPKKVILQKGKQIFILRFDDILTKVKS